MERVFSNKGLNYKSNKNGNITFTLKGLTYFTKSQPSFDNNLESMTYSHDLYVNVSEWGDVRVGKVEYDVLVLDNPDDPEGDGVWATALFHEESDVCNWNEFTVYLD